jgi:hypothetical protein
VRAPWTDDLKPLASTRMLDFEAYGHNEEGTIMFYSHKVCRYLIILILLAISFSEAECFAEIRAYIIEGEVQAAFPMEPTLLGDMGEGKYRTRAYQYDDENNLVSYYVALSLGKLNYKKDDIEQAMDFYIQGKMIPIKGVLISKKITINGYSATARLIYQWRLKGILLTTYSAIIYHQGHYYEWSVEEYQGHSKQSANEIFNAYIHLFKPI